MKKMTHEERQSMRKNYVKRILNMVRTQGFLSLTIQDMANGMNISRASLYNYFSSKEDIVKELTEYHISYLLEADEVIGNDSLSYPLRLEKVFEQAVFSSIYASEVFLHDLEINCPPLYQKKKSATMKRRETVQNFYKKGMKEGVFHTLNPLLLFMQDEVALRYMLNTPFLAEEGLSLKQALHDYFEAKKMQVLKPDVVLRSEEVHIEEVIDYIVSVVSDKS